MIGTRQLAAPTADTGSEGQFVPAGAAERFGADERRLHEAARAAGVDAELYASAFNPYPFRVTTGRLAELLSIQRAVGRALRAVVGGFESDPRLAEVIRLAEDERQLVRSLAGRPYRLGGFRPDFLHAADGRAVITEINARFALNGFLSSSALNGVVPSLFPELRRLEPMSALEGALRQRLGDAGPIGIVRTNEPGWDIHLLRGWWRGPSEVVGPAELTSERLRGWRAVLVELEQRELVAALRASDLALHPGLLNDPRTVLVAHDKRLLALLSTLPYLADHLEAEDRRVLQRHVVPTWVKALAPEIVRRARSEARGWIAKPPRGGKGRGILVAETMSPGDWAAALDAMPGDWVLQPYVEQRLFPICCRQGEAIAIRPMKVVGLLPCLDDGVFGPGMYRASEDAIVNVARGGIILPAAFCG